MVRSFVFGSCICLFLPVAAVASQPRVVADIAPVHSLVAQVMAGVGEPDLVIPPGASPHEYTLRPSNAKALSRADVVFWIGEDLTPWLETPLENLAGSATRVTLLEVPGTTLYEFREGATFDAHDHHGEEGHEEHGHEDEHAHADEHGHKDEHAHEDEHGHDDDHAHEDEHGHDDDHAHKDEHEHHHGEHDPHAWLDPKNAKLWIQTIASVLSEADAANAGSYRNNAAAAIAKLDAQITSIRARTADLHKIRFIVFHDAYQYFERRFDVEASGAISVGDASDPSPARVKEIRDTVASLGVRCVYSEPQFNPDMLAAVFEKTEVTTIAVMDPLGADIAVGQNHYSDLLEAMVTSLSQCQN